MGHRRRLALIVASALLASGPALHAQPDEGSGSAATPSPEKTPMPPAKDPKVARKWLAAAQQLVQKGDSLARAGKAADARAQYENAVTAYQKAIEAGDDVSVYYALALAEDKAGRAPDAYKHLERVIAAQPPVKPDVLKKAQAKLDELSAKVGLVTLTVEPPGTAVSIGDTQVGEAPMAEPLVLLPGTYTVSFAAVGYQPRSVDLKVEASSESERKIALEPVPVVVKAHAPAPEPEQPTLPQPPSKLPLYLGAGATAGLVVVATITGISAIRRHGTYVDPMTTPAERKDAQSSGRTFAHVTDLCLVGAVAGAAFTTYWYLYRYQPRVRAGAEHPVSAKVDVAPWVQPSAGGLVVAGSF